MSSTVYYSESLVSYYDAESHCASFGGSMLEYGQLFIDTANTCQIRLGGIWTGTPFYRIVGR